MVRSSFGSSARASAGGSGFDVDLFGAVVTRWLGECLAVWPSPEWESLNADIAKRPRTDQAATNFRHFLLAGAHEGDPDGQGRLTIPAHLPIELIVVSNGPSHRITLGTTTFSLKAHKHAERLIDSLKAGSYPLRVDGATKAALTIGGSPGP